MRDKLSMPKWFGSFSWGFAMVNQELLEKLAELHIELRDAEKAYDAEMKWLDETNRSWQSEYTNCGQIYQLTKLCEMIKYEIKSVVLDLAGESDTNFRSSAYMTADYQ